MLFVTAGGSPAVQATTAGEPPAVTNNSSLARARGRRMPKRSRSTQARVFGMNLSRADVAGGSRARQDRQRARLATLTLKFAKIANGFGQDARFPGNIAKIANCCAWRS